LGTASILFLIAVLGMGLVSALALEWQTRLERGWDFGWSFRAMQGVLLLLVGAWVFRLVIRGLLRRQGLCLSADRVELWNGYRNPTLLDWKDIKGVSVGESHAAGLSFPLISLLHAGGGRSEITGNKMGSDPNVVAAIVRFYLDHPEQRDALSDPVEALRRVEQAEPSTRVGGAR
jgi:hypothetical protein